MGTAVEKPKDATKLGRVGRASLNPINLGVGAGAAVLAIGLGSLPLGLLGGLAYAALVTFDALTPGKKVPRPVTLPSTLPDPKTIQDPDTRAAVEKLAASKALLQKTVDETPPDVVAHMATTLATLQQLEEHAARLVARSEDIMRHFREVDVSALVIEVKQLQQRAAEANENVAKQTLTEAAQARMDELRSLNELEQTKDDIAAQLTRLVAVFGALPTKLVYMRALDAAAVDRLSGDMNDELKAVGDELRTSEKVIKEVE